MEIDLVRLLNNIERQINVDLTYSFKEEELKDTEIIRLNDLKVVGSIYKDSLDNVALDLNVSGIMILPCAITLKEVEYPFDFDISGTLEENLGENYKNLQNTIDILPIIWENILMEIPMRVVSPDLKPSDYQKEGEGWSFTADDENESPLNELLDLIDE